ncbi:MAG: hypothetical protein MPW17_22195 (plasmid) [Candidatus Manganitrophus sp.]|nr:MAG: hypothetical protein MPW17_22195 [Candidatus Manganitrophus sp.]
MMLNFVKLADFIPVQGQITFTIRKADSDHLLILLHPLFPEIKNLSGKEKELYEKARQPLSIKATPAELNEKFFGLLEETHEDDGRLHRALSEKREAGNQLIEKLQKEKNEAKKKGEVKPIEEKPASGRGRPTTLHRPHRRKKSPLRPVQRRPPRSPKRHLICSLNLPTGLSS